VCWWDAAQERLRWRGPPPLKALVYAEQWQRQEDSSWLVSEFDRFEQNRGFISSLLG
jgi:hypothetical protein